MSTQTAHNFSTQNEPKLGVSQAASYLKITPSTLRRLESEGKISSERLPNGYRQYNFSDLVTLKNQLEGVKAHPKKERPEALDIDGFKVSSTIGLPIDPNIPISTPTPKNPVGKDATKSAVRYHSPSPSPASEFNLREVVMLKRLARLGLALCLTLSLVAGFKFFGFNNIAADKLTLGEVGSKGVIGVLAGVFNNPGNPKKENFHIADLAVGLPNILGDTSIDRAVSLIVNVPSAFFGPTEFKGGLTTNTANVGSLLGLKLLDTLSEATLEKHLDISGDVSSPATGGLANVVVNKIKGISFGDIDPKDAYVLMGDGDAWQSMSTKEITALGTISTGTWEADPVGIAYGGTGLSSYAVGDMVYYQSGSMLSALPIGGSGSVIFSNGTIPAWSTGFTINGEGNITKIRGITYSWPTSQATANRQILTNDGTGNLSWGSIVGVDVDDDTLDFTEFKDQMVLDASADVVLGGFNLTFSGLGNLGIGTTNPSYKLDVNGVARVSGALTLGSVSSVSDNGMVLTTDSGVVKYISTSGWDKNASDDVTTFLGLSDTPSSYASQSGKLVRVSSSENALEFVDASSVGTNYWTLSGSNLYPNQTSYKVGIGNTSPSYALDVTGQARITNLSSSSSNTVVTSNSGLLESRSIDSRVWGTSLVDYTGTPGSGHVAYFSDENTLASEAYLSVSRGGTGVGSTPANGQLLIGNGSGYSLSTLTAGVGIGITNASGSITIVNAGDLSSTNELQNIWATVSSQSGSTTADSQNDTLTIVGAGIASTAISGDTLTITATEAQELFKTISVSGQSDVVADSLTDTLTLIAGSNVTITTNAANDSITISATDTNTTYDAGNGLTLSGTTFKLGGAITEPTRLYDGSHEYLYINPSNGYLGIGTTNPSYKLHVAGALGVGSTAYFASNVGIGTTAPSEKLEIAGNIKLSGATPYIATTTGLDLDLGDFAGSHTFDVRDSNGTNLFTLDSLGNLTLNGQTASSATFNLTPTGTTDVFTINRAGAGTGFAFRVNDAGAGDTSPFVVASAGNVGIGTTSPSSFKLEVAGDIGPEADNTRNLGSATRRFANLYTSNVLQATTGTLTLDTTGAGTVTVGNTASTLNIGGGTNDKTINIGNTTGAGTINIGTSSGNDTVNLLTGSGTNTFNLGASTGSTAGINLNPNASGVIIKASGSTSSQVGLNVTNSGSTSLLYVRADGNVGIGTTSPGGRLDVKSTQTSGTLALLGAPSAVTLSSSLTGLSLDLSTNYTATGFSVTGQTIALPAVTNTGTGTYNYYGLSLTGGALTQNTGAGTNNFRGINLTMPNITQTTGTINSDGLFITTGSITTGGTQNALNIAASGVSAGTLRGLNIGNITAGAGVETAINIGTGWDFGVYSQTSGVNYFAGNVGIGTTAPVAALEIMGTSNQLQLTYDADDYNIWSVASDGTLTHNNNGTNIATYNSAGISFKTPTSFDTAGDVSMAYNLIMSNPVLSGITFEGAGVISTSHPSANYNLTLSAANSGIVMVDDALKVTSRITMDTWTADGDTAVYKNSSGQLGLTSSDVRLKKNLEKISSPLEKVMGLTGYLYNPVEEKDGAKKRLGLLAQDLLAVGLPEATFTFTDGAGQKFYGVHYEKLTALLVEALKEENTKVGALEADVGYIKSVLGLEDLQATQSTASSEFAGSSGSGGLFGGFGETLLTQLQKLYKDFVQLTEALGLKQVDGELVVESAMNVLGDAKFADVAITGDFNAGLMSIDSSQNSFGIVGRPCYDKENNTLNDGLCKTQTLYVQKTLAGGVDFFDGAITFSPDGIITTNQVVAETVSAQVYGAASQGQSVGEGTIPAGETNVFISSSAAKGNYKVFVTATANTEGAELFVKEKQDGGFVVALSQAASLDIKFDWWVVLVR